jgi:hypothetical protein
LGPTHFLTKASIKPSQLEALILTMLRNSGETEEDRSEVSAGQSS